jgi:hypothetical protein
MATDSPAVAGLSRGRSEAGVPQQGRGFRAERSRRSAAGIHDVVLLGRYAMAYFVRGSGDDPRDAGAFRVTVGHGTPPGLAFAVLINIGFGFVLSVPASATPTRSRILRKEMAVLKVNSPRWSRRYRDRDPVRDPGDRRRRDARSLDLPSVQLNYPTYLWPMIGASSCAGFVMSGYCPAPPGSQPLRQARRACHRGQRRLQAASCARRRSRRWPGPTSGNLGRSRSEWLHLPAPVVGCRGGDRDRGVRAGSWKILGGRTDAVPSRARKAVFTSLGPRHRPSHVALLVPARWRPALPSSTRRQEARIVSGPGLTWSAGVLHLPGALPSASSAAPFARSLGTCSSPATSRRGGCRCRQRAGAAPGTSAVRGEGAGTEPRRPSSPDRATERPADAASGHRSFRHQPMPDSRRSR